MKVICKLLFELFSISHVVYYFLWKMTVREAAQQISYLRKEAAAHQLNHVLYFSKGAL